MSYATPAEFIAAIGEREANVLADRDQDGLYEEAVLQAALDEATLQIDGALSQRYQLPLPDETKPEVRAMLRRWCVDIARYRLAVGGVVLTEDAAHRYQDAKTDLDKVIAGKLFIVQAGVDSGLGVNDGTAGMAECDAPPRVFDRPRLAGYHGRIGGGY